ncbi:MAG: enoyl-CoA hydratase/isomerase family protein [Syntrophobacteraceae bacterium]
MSDFNTLIYRLDGHVGHLTLNRPEALNAINETMLSELDDFWRARRHDMDCRVIILTGAGNRGFCGGWDTKEAMPNTLSRDMRGYYRLQAQLSRVIPAMRQAPQPIIACIHGAAVGGGFSFALASDLRIISPQARFAATAINIGLAGSELGASYLLPRLIGAGRAYEFLLTGDFLDAETAWNLGLVSRVVEREQLLPTGLELAAAMCRKNHIGLRLTKETINCNLDAAGLEQALNIEDRNQAICFTTIRYEGQSPQTR